LDSPGNDCSFEDIKEGRCDSSNQSSNDVCGEAERLIKIIEDHDGFDNLDDGFVYFFPQNNGGCLQSWALRVIADELDRRNESWSANIDDYFEKLYKGHEDDER